MTKILNIFYAKIVIASALDDTQNFLKESLISTYLTLTSLLFIERHDQFLVLNRIWTEIKVPIFQNVASTTHITKRLRLQKMKTDFKKKRIPKCPAGRQSLPQKLGLFGVVYSPEKLKASSSVLVSTPSPHPPPKNVIRFSPPFPPPCPYVLPKKNKL